MEVYETLPIVPLRDVVVFPHMMMPFVIGRPASTRALEHALRKDKRIFLAAQHDASVDDPLPQDIYTMGCIANIVQSLKLPDGNVKVLVEGVDRARAIEWKEDKGFYRVVVKVVAKMKEATGDVEGAMSRVVSLFEQYVKLSNNLHYDAMIAAVRVDDPGKLADTIAAHLVVAVDEKQNLLEIVSPLERLNRIAGILEAEVDKLQVDRRIQSRVKKQMEKAQKEYYLNEKMKAIQKELGRKDEKGNEVDDLKKKIEQAQMPKDVEEKAIQELKRLEAMPPMSAEATVSRNYLDWLIAVPWHKKTKESRDLKRAEEILNEDHYGLDKIKERILEFLAVRALVKKPKATILTFSGPPGVGKTSLAKSIARAMNRKFVRLSLGGVRDEAEIRGHRRTYIGAFPGQIIQMMKKAGTQNPVFLLDEVDKMSMDFRGDPSAALLEVLDPEQNHMFLDHYLDVEYDLSHVMFICTANVLHTVPQALRDRMEVLQLPGYTEQEKTEIAKRFLVPKSVEGTGLTPDNITFTDDALQTIIQRYTREAGVRNLEREIGSICRKVARKVVVDGKGYSEEITPERVTTHLGVPRFRPTMAEEKNEIGIATGLAWTEVGRRDPRHRGDADAGQGAPDAHRQARRRDAGVGAGRDELRALAGRGVRHPQGLQPAERRPHPRPRGRHPQGRPVGRHHDGHRARVGAHARPGPQGRRDDGRDHAARQGAADRRRQGEGPRGAPRRREDASSCRRRTRRTWPTSRRPSLDVLNVYLVETMDEVLKIALADALPPPLTADGPAVAAVAPTTRRGTSDQLRIEIRDSGPSKAEPPSPTSEPRFLIPVSCILSLGLVLSPEPFRPSPRCPARIDLAEFVTSAVCARDLPRDGLPEVALVGRSNVGKSTLINALVRRRSPARAPRPARRAWSTSTASRPEDGRAGQALRLLPVDLPGYGHTSGGEKARAGVRRADEPLLRRPEGSSPSPRAVAEASAEAGPLAGCILAVDARHPGLQSDVDALRWLSTLDVPALVVATKSDKLSQSEQVPPAPHCETAFGTTPLTVSALKGEGLDELWRVLRTWTAQGS